MKELKALQTALQSGNLADAQTAFANFQSDLEARAQAGIGNSPLSQNGHIRDDITSLQSALDSNDITTAQQAFVTLKQDLRMLKQQHAPQPDGGPSTTPPTDDTATTSPESIAASVNLQA
jgi:hypothetical protein